jgi:hypothetical protein
MTIGSSVGYKINGNNIPDPERAEWRPRRPLGVAGSGQAVYPEVREFRMRWRLLPLDDLQTLYDIYAGATTGTSVVELPDPYAGSWTFREFSGVNVEEPTFGDYFEEHAQSVALVLTNIEI